eukprot:762433-Hanusia_phi.AAC.1
MPSVFYTGDTENHPFSYFTGSEVRLRSSRCAYKREGLRWREGGIRKCGMRECLRCAWPDLDDPPRDWMQRPLTSKSLMLLYEMFPALMLGGTELARGSILAEARAVVEGGLCPGVTHMCPSCQRITMLVEEGCLDVAQGILEALARKKHMDMIYADWDPSQPRNPADNAGL